jgi:hypothetical protein
MSNGEYGNLGNYLAQTLSSGGGGSDSSAANQLLEIAALDSIDGKFPDLVDGAIPVELNNLSNSLNWTTIRTFNADTTALTFNTRPTNPGGLSPNITNGNYDFIGLTDFSISNSSEIEILPKLKTSLGASPSINIWVYDGSESYCIESFTCSPTENNISSSDSNGSLDGVSPIKIDLNRYNASLQIQAIINLSLPTVVFSNTGACVNPGLTGGELVTLSSTGVLPFGLSGHIASANTSTDNVTLSGITFADTEYVRINLQSIGTNIIPCLGLAQSAKAADINGGNDTITFDGLVTDFSFTVGMQVRFRTSPGNTLPSVAGTAISATTTYTIISATGSAGSQTIKIGTDGNSPLTITSVGTGFFFCFPYPFIYVYQKGASQLSYSSGGTAINFRDYYSAVAITLTAGSASIITQAGHGYTTGQTIVLGGNTAPGTATFGRVYYVNAINANSYNLSNIAGGLLLAFSSTGTAVTGTNGAGVTSSISVATGTLAGITLTNHFLTTNQPITLAAAVLPTGYTASQILYVVATGLTASSFGVSDIEGGAPIVFGSTGTTVTLTANLCVGQLPIEKTSAYIAQSPVPTNSQVSFANTSNGAAISLIANSGNGVHTFIPSASPQILSGSYIKARSY